MFPRKPAKQVTGQKCQSSGGTRQLRAAAVHVRHRETIHIQHSDHTTHIILDEVSIVTKWHLRQQESNKCRFTSRYENDHEHY
jgi:hypothetical protein